jgi:hypothetical protein
VSPFEPQQQAGGCHITRCGDFRVSQFIQPNGTPCHDKRTASSAHGPSRPQQPVFIQHTEDRTGGNLGNIETALPHLPVKHLDIGKPDIQGNRAFYSVIRQGVKNKGVIWTRRISKSEWVQFQPRFIKGS